MATKGIVLGQVSLSTLRNQSLLELPNSVMMIPCLLFGLQGQVPAALGGALLWEDDLSSCLRISSLQGWSREGVRLGSAQAALNFSSLQLPAEQLAWG